MTRIRTAAVIATGLAALASPAAAQQAAAWRDRVRAFAEAHLQHTAWGVAHARRDYEGALRLAAAEGLKVDDDVLFAAAYLHDMGAFPAYAKDGVDHGERAVELVDPILRDAGFPMEKAPLVHDAIAHHMYYHTPGASPEAVVFRDADTLDFLGAIGVARIVSLTTRHRWAPDLPASVETLRRNLRELPPTLTTAAAKREAAHRIDEMRTFLDALHAEAGDVP
jgi:uncharacterized protein